MLIESDDGPLTDELGMSPEAAITTLQKSRAGCMLHYAQQRYCYSLAVGEN